MILDRMDPPMRPLTPTEEWLATWLNQNGSFMPCHNPVDIPVLGSFMIPALAKAIDERIEQKS